MPRAATIESERELVKVVVEVLVTDRALVGSEQPGLQHGDNQVNSREQLAGRPLALERGPLMLVPELVQAQGELDQRWHALCANDPDVVLATLAEAFEDNEAPAAPVGVHGDEVAIVVLVPGLDVVPERMPQTTAAGNLSMPKLTKAKRADFYKLVVCGHLLATCRETFAVAPGVNSVRAAVIRRGWTTSGTSFPKRGPSLTAHGRPAVHPPGDFVSVSLERLVRLSGV